MPLARPAKEVSACQDRQGGTTSAGEAADIEVGPLLGRATRGGAAVGAGVVGRQPVSIWPGAPFYVCVRKGGPASTPPRPSPYIRAAYVGRFGRRDEEY